MNNQITILLSHPNISNSMFNKHLVDINRKNPNFVFHHLADGNDVKPLLVHRIDKNTSGIMIVAKSI